VLSNNGVFVQGLHSLDQSLGHPSKLWKCLGGKAKLWNILKPHVKFLNHMTTHSSRKVCDPERRKEK
jgi:hypothetical protein